MPSRSCSRVFWERSLPVSYRLAYAVCLVLSVLYSVPPFRLKAVPGADWLINMWGFGTLTPYAGWAATGLPLRPARGTRPDRLLSPVRRALSAHSDLSVRGGSRRGDRTLARILGIRRSLLVAVGGAALGFALFAGAGKLAGWGPDDSWRWGALAVSAAAWGLLLFRWLHQHRRMTARDHQRGMYRALGPGL